MKKRKEKTSASERRALDDISSESRPSSHPVRLGGRRDDNDDNNNNNNNPLSFTDYLKNSEAAHQENILLATVTPLYLLFICVTWFKIRIRLLADIEAEVENICPIFYISSGLPTYPNLYPSPSKKQKH